MRPIPVRANSRRRLAVFLLSLVVCFFALGNNVCESARRSAYSSACVSKNVLVLLPDGFFFFGEGEREIERVQGFFDFAEAAEKILTA
jgi:hypothetical protein